MQKFIAEVSNVIDGDEFAKSWKSDSATHSSLEVDFAFAGRRISATVHSNPDSQWQSESFRRAVSAVIRRVDRACNIRWL
jgi:hypothetical protein